uniref:HTH La-type RNA-binding domain-containing protein n=1 Tax=Haemonchus contortus TaxID=6289 RepID=A0A7I4Y924_HAECO
MSAVDAKLVRQEIDELLTSGRLQRLETISAHIFQMYGREWREMTSHEILVHLFHDSLDNMDKLLARNRYELIFDFVPLSASFTFTCLSRKFVRLSLNKFDRSAPAYGFGFSNLRDMEIFCTQLDRIRNYAKATLVPPVRSIALGLANLGLQSPSSTPPRMNIPSFYADSARTDCLESARYCPSTPLHVKPNSSMIFSDSPSRYHLPYNECISDEYALAEAAAAVPICEAPNLSKVEPNENIQLGQNEGSDQPFSKLIAAEHRVRALIDAIQPAGGVNDVWSNSIEKMTEGSMVTSSTATNRAENPAGVIGSPVKGKGGAYACRHKASIDT